MIKYCIFHKFNQLPQKSAFWHTKDIYLWKTWEKEKLLVTSNFSFSHNVFFPLFSILTLSQRQILDSSKLRRFADNNFNSIENGRKFFKGTENTMGRKEIACYEQFLLSPQCFQKTYTANTWKPGLVWERVKCTLKRLQFVSIWTSLKLCHLVMG